MQIIVILIVSTLAFNYWLYYLRDKKEKEQKPLVCRSLAPYPFIPTQLLTAAYSLRRKLRD